MKTRMNFKDEFYQKLKLLVLPIAIQNFMLALVSATDAIMLGWIDQTSLSAVSLAGQVQFVLNLFITGIAAGAGIMAAQYWGKRDAASIEKVIPIALRANLLFSGLFTILAGLCPGSADADLYERCSPRCKRKPVSARRCTLLRALRCLTGLPDSAEKHRPRRRQLPHQFHGGCAEHYFKCRPDLRSLRRSGTRHPRRGVCNGSGRVLELIWAYIETKKPDHVRILWKRLFSSAGKMLSADFWRYTLPVLAAALVWGIAYVLYSVIMGHMGSDAVAANSITTIAKSLLSCLIRGVSGGAGVLIGNLLGANELEKAREYGGRLSRLAIVIGIVTGGLLMLISPAIVHFAPLTDTAADYLQYMLLFCGLNLMAQSVNTTVLDGIFCAGGDAKFDMQGNIGAMWCFSVPLGFLAAFWLKLPVMVVYCIVNLDEIVKLPAVYLHYKKYVWVRNITRDIEE